METFKEKLIEIIGFGMERERAECKADEILSLFSYPRIEELIKAQQELIERYEREFIKNGLISTGDIIGETRLCKVINNLRVRIAQLRKEVGI